MKKNTHLDEDAYFDAEGLGESLYDDMDELAAAAAGGDDDEVAVELFFDENVEKYGFEVMVKGSPVHVEATYESLFDAIDAFRWWCKRKTGE